MGNLCLFCLSLLIACHGFAQITHRPLNAEDFTKTFEIVKSNDVIQVDVDIELEEQIKYYKAYWRRNKQTSYHDFKLNDTAYFKFPFGFTSKDQKSDFNNNICAAKAIILEKNPKGLKLKVKLIESCDLDGIIISKEDITGVVDMQVVIIEKDKKVFMKEGEVLWLKYDLWFKED